MFCFRKRKHNSTLQVFYLSLPLVPSTVGTASKGRQIGSRLSSLDCSASRFLCGRIAVIGHIFSRFVSTFPGRWTLLPNKTGFVSQLCSGWQVTSAGYTLAQFPSLNPNPFQTYTVHCLKASPYQANAGFHHDVDGATLGRRDTEEVLLLRLPQKYPSCLFTFSIILSLLFLLLFLLVPSKYCVFILLATQHFLSCITMSLCLSLVFKELLDK